MPEEICAARGCVRTSALGLLCPEHGQRLADHYGAREGHGSPGRTSHGLPWMYDHVEIAYPSLAGWSGGTLGRDDIDDAEAQKLAAVIDLRTEIHDHLTITARELADDLGRKGPDLATSERKRVRRAAGWLLAHIESLRAAQGARATGAAVTAAAAQAITVHAVTEPVNVYTDRVTTPAGVVQSAVAAAHAGAARWAVRGLLEEADDLASRAHALAPWRPAPTRLKGIPCRCGAVGTVHDHGDIRKCWRCGRGYDEAQWAALMKVLAYRFRDHEGQTA